MANKENYTREEFEAALEAERSKLNGRISETDERTKTLQEELKQLQKFRTDAEKAEAKRLKEIEDAKQAAENEKLSAKELIEKQQAQWQEQLAQVQAQQAAERELLAKEVSFMRLAAYTQRRINEEQDAIAPELLDYIDGDSEEAVEASIEKAKTKTAAILEGMQAAGKAQRAAQVGTLPGGAGVPLSPLDVPDGVNLSDLDIKGMSNAEYAKLRGKLGIGTGGQGMFG